MRVSLPKSAVDLAVALLRGSEGLPSADRDPVLAQLLKDGPVPTRSAAYRAAYRWAHAVSTDSRPIDPVVFRSLGRYDDWLAAVLFLREVLRTSALRLRDPKVGGANQGGP